MCDANFNYFRIKGKKEGALADIGHSGYFRPALFFKNRAKVPLAPKSA